MNADTTIRPIRCLTCFYILEGLPPGQCPECGESFDPADSFTYTRRPPFVRWRYWLPGLLLCAGLTFFSLAMFFTIGGFGWGFTIALPLVAGAALGYATRGGIAALVFLGLIGAAGVIGSLMTMSLAGGFCLLVMAGVFILPAFLGLGAGVVLRIALKQSSFSMREYLPIVLMFLIPPGVAAIEPGGYSRAEIILTTGTIDAPPDRVWDAMEFYEEVDHTPPVLMRLLLPAPIRVTGDRSAPGDVTRCEYDAGTLGKRITDVKRPERLGFEMFEQGFDFDGSIDLVGGSFTLTPVGDHQTRVTLATEYRSKLRPRWAWRWGERMAVGTLHRHVIEGVRRGACCQPGQLSEAHP